MKWEAPKLVQIDKIAQAKGDCGVGVTIVACSGGAQFADCTDGTSASVSGASCIYGGTADETCAEGTIAGSTCMSGITAGAGYSCSDGGNRG